MNFWQKVELGIVFIFFIEGAQPLPLYGVLPWGVSDGVGEGWGISAGKGGGKGSRKGKWGVCRKREGWETGEIFYQGKSRKNQYLHASACFLMSWKELEHFDFNHLECGLGYTVFSNAMKGT